MRRTRLAARAVLVLCALGWLERGAVGAEAPEGAVRISGRVAAARDATRAVRSATLTTPQGVTYQLVMDERGRSFAGVMHGESAEILGVAAEKDGVKWLRVVDYTDERVAAGHEYWRRMRCLACVVLPATRNAAAPVNLRGAKPVAGRHFALKRTLTAWTRDARFLWAASDNEVYQIDLAAGSLVRTFGRSDGLPDQMVYQLLSDGATLWILHRGGVAALEIGRERLADLPRLRAAFARVHADSGGVWVVADTGTFRLKSPSDAPREFPALLTAEQVRRFVQAGIWETHWRRRTAHLITAPASISGRLYAGSYGDLYELADGAWRRIVEGAWEQTACGGKLWFLSAAGLGEYDPETGKAAALAPPEAVRGRYTRLLVASSGAWLAAEPEAVGKDGPAPGGGLARFDLAARTWLAYTGINGYPAQAVACLASDGDDVWVATLEGRYRSRSAHPGMTTTLRLEFDATGAALHRYDAKADAWQSFPLELREVEKRLICGQDGKHSPDVIAPQLIEELSIGPTHIFALARLAPRQFFGGYWPCIAQVASRPRGQGAWAATLEHRPGQLWLQGEQPLVLNISSGELTRIGSALKDHAWEAVGHDLVLGLFVYNGRHWAVTEGCVAFFDEAAQTWRRIIEPQFRWYWRATAAFDDGRSLFVGSDTGLLARLDLAAGRFEFIGALKDRSIARIVGGKGGGVLIEGRQAPLSRLPAQLVGRFNPLDCDVALYDGKALAPAPAAELPPPEPAPQWTFKQFDRNDHLDKSQGNYLCGPPAGEPRYYVKETFFPLFLCLSPDGSRMWLSNYTGLTRLDLAVD